MARLLKFEVDGADDIAASLREQMGDTEMLDAPLRARVWLVAPHGSEHALWGRTAALLDAAQGVAYCSNGAIEVIEVRRIWGTMPQAVLELSIVAAQQQMTTQNRDTNGGAE